jgi:hypothetical protein
MAAHQMHLNKSGGMSMASMTACGRNILRTPMACTWAEFKLTHKTWRCIKCDESKQAALNARTDAKKEAA